MTDAHKSTTADAIGQVLQAEHLAEQDLRRCHQDARRIVEQARNQARAIEARADVRIQRVHRQRETRIAELQTSTLKSCTAVLAEPPCNEQDRPLIEDAVRAMAHALLGPHDDTVS